MTIQQLKYIVALDDERHFARAAELCMVSQPGLTIQLKKLEEEIGIQLFDRSRTPLAPTPAGKDIILKARKLLMDADIIRDYIIDKKNILEGSIKLGVISTLSPYLIPIAIDSIRMNLPNVDFTIEEHGTLELIEGLEHGTLDVALMATPTGNKNLKEFCLFQEKFVIYENSNKAPLDLKYYSSEDLDHARLLLLKTEYCYNAQLLNICEITEEQNKDNQFKFDINSIETLKNLVRSDLGYAIVPELSILNDYDDKFVQHFKAPEPTREISLVVSESFEKKLLLEKLKEAFWNVLPEKCRTSDNYTKIKWNDSPYFRKNTGT